MSTSPQLDISSGLVGKASLSSAPDFLQPALVSQHTRMVPGDPTADSVAHVDSLHPSDIVIDRPDLANQATVNHEATHVLQGTMEEPMRYANPSGTSRDVYDYGGWEGVRKAQENGKTIRDFSDEQQAKMVQDYTDLKKYVEQPSKTNAERQKKAAEWDKATQAFGPYLRQLASQPHKYDPVAIRDLVAAAFPGSVMEKMNTTPVPPGPPPASVSGMAKPLPEWGGSTIDISAGLVKKGTR